MKDVTCSSVDTEAELARMRALTFFIQGVKNGGILGIGGEVFGKVSDITLSNLFSSSWSTWEWAVRAGGAWKIEEWRGRGNLILKEVRSFSIRKYG